MTNTTDTNWTPDDMILTDTQCRELDALRTIWDILDGFGDDSHIVAAFAGCLEMAEMNIRYGEHKSMQAQRDAAEAKAKHNCEMAASFHEKLEDARRERGVMRQRIMELLDMYPTKDELKECFWLATARASELRDDMAQVLADIAEHADNPDGDTFKTSIDMYKNLKEKIKDADALVQRLMDMDAYAQQLVGIVK